MQREREESEERSPQEQKARRRGRRAADLVEPVVLFQEVDFLRPTTCELSWDRRIVWSSRVGRLSVSGSNNSGSSTGSGTAGTALPASLPGQPELASLGLPLWL
ncbi:hypothetical protein VCV18_006056 [Metarhizium anisopliae]